jgi:predicted NBD/HSP70 family sugar kinase
VRKDEALMTLFWKLLRAVPSWQRRRDGPRAKKRADVSMEQLDHRQLMSVDFTGNVIVDFPETTTPGVVVLTPDRVVLGGGVSGAGDLLFEPIRREIAQRVRTTDLAQIEIVPAELGTWAGAIGAAVHGAEQAAVGTGASVRQS